jgi:hypothetical protein
VHRTFIWLLASGAWGGGLLGTLHLQGLPTSVFGAHGVCGPWGCGPPVPVLLACHGFWMVLLGPPAVVAAFRLPGRWVRLLGMLLILLGAAGLLGVGLWEAATWFREASGWQRQYVVQRYCFAVVTLVDFPILEVLIVGSGLSWADPARLRKSARPVFTPSEGSRVEPSALQATSDSV